MVEAVKVSELVKDLPSLRVVEGIFRSKIN